MSSKKTNTNYPIIGSTPVEADIHTDSKNPELKVPVTHTTATGATTYDHYDTINTKKDQIVHKGDKQPTELHEPAAEKNYKLRSDEKEYEFKPRTEETKVKESKMKVWEDPTVVKKGDVHYEEIHEHGILPVKDEGTGIHEHREIKVKDERGIHDHEHEHREIKVKEEKEDKPTIKDKIKDVKENVKEKIKERKERKEEKKDKPSKIHGEHKAHEIKREEIVEKPGYEKKTEIKKVEGERKPVIEKTEIKKVEGDRKPVIEKTEHTRVEGVKEHGIHDHEHEHRDIKVKDERGIREHEHRDIKVKDERGFHEHEHRDLKVEGARLKPEYEKTEYTRVEGERLKPEFEKTEYTRVEGKLDEYNERDFKRVNAGEVPFVSVGKGPVEILDPRRTEIHEPREEREYGIKDEDNIHVKFNINKT